jgi:hypothetical protein
MVARRDLSGILVRLTSSPLSLLDLPQTVASAKALTTASLQRGIEIGRTFVSVGLSAAFADNYSRICGSRCRPANPQVCVVGTYDRLRDLVFTSRCDEIVHMLQFVGILKTQRDSVIIGIVILRVPNARAIDKCG